MKIGFISTALRFYRSFVSVVFDQHVRNLICLRWEILGRSRVDRPLYELVWRYHHGIKSARLKTTSFGLAQSGVVVLAMPLLAGCSTTDVFHHSNRSIESELTLIGPSAQPIVKNADGTICYGPQPDATIDEIGAVSSPSISIGAADEELPLGGRNPNVLITRDIFFQSCLAESRIGLSKAEKLDLYIKTLEAVQTVNSSSLEGSSVESDYSTQRIVVPTVSTAAAEDSDSSGYSGF